MSDDRPHPIHLPPRHSDENSAPIIWDNMPPDQQMQFMRNELNRLRAELAKYHSMFQLRADGSIAVKKTLVLDAGVDVIVSE